MSLSDQARMLWRMFVCKCVTSQTLLSVLIPCLHLPDWNGVVCNTCWNDSWLTLRGWLSWIRIRNHLISLDEALRDMANETEHYATIQCLEASPMRICPLGWLTPFPSMLCSLMLCSSPRWRCCHQLLIGNATMVLALFVSRDCITPNSTTADMVRPCLCGAQNS